MKPLFYTKTLIAVAVAIAAATAAVSQAQDQPAPPPAADGSSLPADIVPGSPLADVVKMIRAGVDPATIKTYVQNSTGPFNLDADQILFLKDEGAPSDLINAMMDRDKAFYASSVTPPPAPAPVVAAAPVAPAPPMDEPAPDTAPPAAPITVDYFNSSLSSYGTWINVDGYGRCWRPTAVLYDGSWRPYCDRGHWVYTDYGWYWDSDYAWGVTFHYGRWFQDPRFGWIWYPDTVWAPSWVAWRSNDAYCGWAPLPPFAVFQPGIGFYYRGVSVGLDFDFGLNANCFVFASPEHICDRRVSSFCVPRDRVTVVFHQTTIINHYDVSSKTIVNRGISIDHIRQVTHQNITPVHMSALPNAGRQGWRGAGYEQTLRPTTYNYNHTAVINNNSTHDRTTGVNENNNHTYAPANQGNDQWHNATLSHETTGQNNTTTHQTESYSGQTAPRASGGTTYSSGQPHSYYPTETQPRVSQSQASQPSVPVHQYGGSSTEARTGSPYEGRPNTGGESTQTTQPRGNQEYEQHQTPTGAPYRPTGNESTQHNSSQGSSQGQSSSRNSGNGNGGNGGNGSNNGQNNNNNNNH